MNGWERIYFAAVLLLLVLTIDAWAVRRGRVKWKVHFHVTTLCVPCVYFSHSRTSSFGASILCLFVIDTGASFFLPKILFKKRSVDELLSVLSSIAWWNLFIIFFHFYRRRYLIGWIFQFNRRVRPSIQSARGGWWRSCCKQGKSFYVGLLKKQWRRRVVPGA